jgi:predicted metal-dependent peptidase
MSMVPVVTERVERAATDKFWRVYVNPRFFASLSAEEGAMVLVHEVWHLLSDHWKRADLFGVRPDERDIWNIAGDCEINTKDDLWKRLPKDCVRPAIYKYPDNLLAEEYFNLIKKDPDFPQGGVTGTICAGGCGSCAHGYTDDFELPGPEEKNGSPGVTKTRAKLIQDETARQIIEQSSTGIGSIPAGWVRWAKRVLKPEIDWRVYIRSVVQGMLTSLLGHSIPTYRRMARRQFKYPDFIIPAYQDPIPHVAVIIDTSGSMSDDYVAQGVAEVDGILRTVGRGILVDVYFTDAAAADVQRVTCASELIPYGGGGTDMREGFNAIEKRAITDPSSRPAVIVIVTDGLTPWPEEPPAYAQVCVVLVGNGGGSPGWASPPRHNTVKIKVKEPDGEDDAN